MRHRPEARMTPMGLVSSLTSCKSRTAMSGARARAADRHDDDPAGLVATAVFSAITSPSARSRSRLPARSVVATFQDGAGAVGPLATDRRRPGERSIRYRQHELTEVQAHDIIIRALDDRAITVTQVAILQMADAGACRFFAADRRSA